MSKTSEATLSIVEEHFEETVFLLGQWSRAKVSSQFTLGEVKAFEERIDAHASALQAYRPEGLDYVSTRLKSEDPFEVQVALWWLLRQKVQGGDELALKLFQSGSVPSLKRAAVEAIALASGSALAARVLEVNGGEDAETLLLQMRLAADQNADVLTRFPLSKSLRLPDPALRLRAWQCANRCARATTAEQTLAGALDADPMVRQLALLTAAWAGQGWVLEHCRRAAAKPTTDHWAELELLSVLADEKDAAQILGLAAKPELGPKRFQLLGTLGQAAGVPVLVQAMSSSNPEVAAGAGAAFTRITGRTLRIINKVALPPKDGSVPDDFEKEFLEEVGVPDAKEAEAHWEAHQSKYQPGQRYSQGLLVPAAPPFSPELDVVSIREACLRAAFAGKAGLQVVDFERFPLAF
jgi:uncharacterized protein (TIGR02270 family)